MASTLDLARDLVSKPSVTPTDGGCQDLIADALAPYGFEPEVMNGLFMIARVPGLVAHVREEQVRMKPMRRISPTDHSYDGPAARSLD